MTPCKGPSAAALQQALCLAAASEHSSLWLLLPIPSVASQTCLWSFDLTFQAAAVAGAGAGAAAAAAAAVAAAAAAAAGAKIAMKAKQQASEAAMLPQLAPALHEQVG